MRSARELVSTKSQGLPAGWKINRKQHTGGHPTLDGETKTQHSTSCGGGKMWVEGSNTGPSSTGAEARSQATTPEIRARKTNNVEAKHAQRDPDCTKKNHPRRKGGAWLCASFPLEPNTKLWPEGKSNWTHDVMAIELHRNIKTRTQKIQDKNWISQNQIKHRENE
jgi:hypothetical protein